MDKKEYKKLWKKNNPDKVKAGSRRQYIKYKDNIIYKEIKKNKLRNWRNKNRDKINKDAREKYANNPKKHKEYCLKWRENHPDNYFRFRKSQIDKKRKILGSHTLKEWQELKKRFNNCCAICGRQEPFTDLWYQYLTEDHIIPISRGGTGDIDNIQPTCVYCNRKKSNKI